MPDTAVYQVLNPNSIWYTAVSGIWQTVRLQPDGLPDAGYRGIPDAVGIQHLFAARLRPGVAGVPYGHDNFFGCFALQRGRDVERERVIAAFVLPDGLAVDPHFGAPVHGPEMQKQPLAFQARRGERAAIPQPLVGRERLPDARQRGFHRKRHQNAAVVFGPPLLPPSP